MTQLLPPTPCVPLPAYRARRVVMVEPANFGFNVQTAATNNLQNPVARTEVAGQARAEAAAVVSALRQAGIGVCVVPDTTHPPKPDALFPNNWVSFHADGTVVLYPMLTPNRRIERREELIATVAAQLGFAERRRLDFTANESRGRFLEGTGSLVIDHAQGRVFACHSPRTDESLVREWASAMNFEPVIFDACTADGTAVYHTNVLLWIGERTAALGVGWVVPADRDRVLGHLQVPGRSVLQLGSAQLAAFAGNMLELASNTHGRTVLVMSDTARRSLSADQDAQLQATNPDRVVVTIPTIERVGGGGVRCLLAEVP